MLVVRSHWDLGVVFYTAVLQQKLIKQPCSLLETIKKKKTGHCCFKWRIRIWVFEAPWYYKYLCTCRFKNQIKWKYLKDGVNTAK